jgi:hypothetical protein
VPPGTTAQQVTSIAGAADRANIVKLPELLRSRNQIGGITPRKQTSWNAVGMSALRQKRTFNHVVEKLSELSDESWAQAASDIAAYCFAGPLD